MFTAPIPSDEWNAAFLDPAVNSQWTEPVWKTYNWQEEHSGEIYAAGLAVINRVIPGGRLIDVGTGAGLFVQLAGKAGYDALGTEILPEQVSRARALGIPVIHGGIREAAGGRLFDVVTLWCVVAHVAEVPEFLGDCFAVLRPGGMIFVETPNMTLWRFLRPLRAFFERVGIRPSNPDALWAYGHINHFTARSLAATLGRCGFADIEMHTVPNYGEAQGLVDRAKHGLFRGSGGRLNFCFPLVMTARKPEASRPAPATAGDA